MFRFRSRTQILETGRRGWVDLDNQHRKVFNWEYSTTLRGPKLELETYSGDSNDGVMLILGFCFITFYLSLDRILKPNKEYKSYSYGFYFFHDSFCIFWKKAEGGYSNESLFNKTIWLPYITWKHIEDKNVMLMKDNSWKRVSELCEGRPHNMQWYPHWQKEGPAPIPEDDRWSAIYDYEYTLRSGKVQKRRAFVYIESRTWKRKWFPFSKMTKKALNFEFSDEVGERTGSWKGGAISSSIDMEKEEQPLQAFRRMEKDRKF